MEVVVVKYPGASAAEETAYAFSEVAGAETRIVWHDEETFGEPGLLVLPGGASFCDYLRPGALARTSRISPSIRRFARQGRVLGIGNGFQILCELGVLPGVLLRNADLRFCNREVFVRLGSSNCPLTAGLEGGRVFRLPVACGYGRYFVDHRTLADMKEKGLVVLRYSNEEGELSDGNSVTGSLDSIAGVTNHKGNVLGMMVRPERAVESFMGGTDGLDLLRAAAGL